MQLLSLVLLHFFVPSPSGKTRLTHTCLFISFFLGLAASHLIHSWTVLGGGAAYLLNRAAVYVDPLFV
jgi:hypothetical protein